MPEWTVVVDTVMAILPLWALWSWFAEFLALFRIPLLAPFVLVWTVVGRRRKWISPASTTRFPAALRSINSSLVLLPQLPHVTVVTSSGPVRGASFFPQVSDHIRGTALFLVRLLERIVLEWISTLRLTERVLLLAKRLSCSSPIRRRRVLSALGAKSRRLHQLSVRRRCVRNRHELILRQEPGQHLRRIDVLRPSVVDTIPIEILA